jgi:uncharacterized protein (TIGR03435 family)
VQRTAPDIDPHIGSWRTLLCVFLPHTPPAIAAAARFAKPTATVPLFSPPSTTPDTNTIPDIFSALQWQPGLNPEQKVAVEVFVVDHREKAPAGN